jgi:hypothetical protein
MLAYPLRFGLLVDKPSAPKNLKETFVDERSIEIQWSAPESDGGADITGKHVLK